MSNGLTGKQLLFRMSGLAMVLVAILRWKDWVPYLQNASPRQLGIWGGVLVAGMFLVILIKWLTPLAIKGWFYWKHRKRAMQDVRYVLILPPNDIEENPQSILTFVRAFGAMGREFEEKWKKGRPWFRLRITRLADIMPKGSPLYQVDDKLIFILGFPQDKETGVKSVINGVYPNAGIHELRHEDVPQATEGGTGGYFRLKKGRWKGLPLASILEKKENPMGYILPRIREGVFLDIFFSTASWEELLEERSEDVMEEIRGKSVKDLDPQEHHAKNYLSKRFTGMEYNYQVAISILANEPEKSNVKNLANGIEEVMNRQGKIKFWRHRRWDPLQRFNPSKTLNPMPLPLPNAHMTLVDTELACLLHLPPGNERIYQKPKTEESKDRGTVLHLKKGQRLPKKEDFTEGAAGLGKVWYPLATERFIYIANHVLKKHMAIFGRTGSGKSSFALMIIKSIIKKWAEGKPGGFLAFDPKADTVFQILTYLVALDKELKKSGSGLKWEKIHFFDLGSDKYPVGMNMLHRYDGETDNDVALRAEEILKSASNSDAHTLLETYGRPALRLLTADKEPHSILELDAVLAKNPAYRKTLKKKLAPKLNPRLRRKWKEIEKDVSKGFETKSLRNRLEKFAEDDVLKRIFGQKKMSLDLRESMDDSHIVLFKANRLNDEQLRIIGGYVASQLYTVAKQRKKDAVLFPVLFEEFQLYQVPAMKKLLSLSRDKGVPMIGLTQFPDQLESWLYDAIFENVGTIISCALGEKSAERVAGLTGKGKEDEGFSAKDLIALGKEGSRIGAVMTENENEQREFMYLQADPPYMYGPDGKPIYWGTDTERHSREKEAAKVAAQKFAEKHLASRDCLTAEEIDRDIDQFYIDLETLERTHDLKQKSTQDDDFDDLGGDEDSWWLEDDNDAV